MLPLIGILTFKDGLTQCRLNVVIKNFIIKVKSFIIKSFIKESQKKLPVLLGRIFQLILRDLFFTVFFSLKLTSNFFFLYFKFDF